SRTSLVTDGSAFGGVIPGPDNQVADYMTNSLNQYTDITTTVNSDQQVTNVPVYDDDGNLTEISDYPGSLKYSYNAENRLVAAAPELPMQGDGKVEFVYDYMGRRVKKTVSVWNGSWVQEAEKLFVYDGWNMICEITSENSQPATEKYYVWGLDLSQSLQGAGGIGGLIATLDNSVSVVYYYFYDANGNVGQLVNASDGSIAAHYEYDPFGNIIKAEGEYKDSNPYRFSTKYIDSETGLIYYVFRYLSTDLGRWLNRDPLGEEGGINLYGFIQNDPLNHIDPYGMSPWSIILKKAAKLGIKKGIKEYIENRIKKEILGSLKNKAYKKAAKELGDEAMKVLDLLESEWWEVIIECVVPVAGDIYGVGKLADALREIDKKLDAIEKKGRTLLENEELLSKWDPSTFSNALESVTKHANKKGYDVDKYLRKAANFNKKGAKPKVYQTEHGWRKKWERLTGEYIIETLDGKIVTYGQN
ncbi:MAG: RHS repeat-associated core domain-containing protein, partial [Desulfobacterales bacterium]|nr:RHS repeat-associated core domain-containing protein [Desulfobacterales bacterium]